MPATNRDPEGGSPGRGPSWVLPFLAGSAVVAVGTSLRGCRSQSVEKGGKGADSTATNVNTTAASLPQAALFYDSAEALNALKTGAVSTNIVELAGANSESFTYVFTNATNSTHTAMLRGVVPGAHRDQFLKQLREEGARTVIEVPSAPAVSPAPGVPAATAPNPWWSHFVWPVTLVAGVLILGRYLSKHFGGIGEALRSELGGDDKHSNLQKFVERPKDRFSDVGGNQTVVAEMRALVEKLRAYQKGDLPIRLPRGILMHGAPGVGKTFMARVLCGEAETAMFYMNAGDLTSSSYMGAWTRAVKKLFKDARDLRDQGTKELRKGGGGTERQAVVIFLDEFDSIGRARGAESSHGEHERAVNTLLSELDGIDEIKNSGIIVIAATNNPEGLDPALKRPGRFTLQFAIPGPQTSEERLDVLRKVSSKILPAQELRLASEEALEELAKVTQGTSPDHLRGMVDRASELALRAERNRVSREDLFEAYQQTMFGHPYDDLVAPERRVHVAAHELGHGLTAVACGRSPLIVSMRPRGDSLGRVVVDAHPLTEAAATRDDLFRALIIAAGGRAGELLHFGSSGTSPGVSGDFRSMEKIARLIIDSGMTNGGFSPQVAEADTWELSPAYQAELKRICAGAIAAAREIGIAVGRDRFRSMVRDATALESELIGPQAAEFFTTRVGVDELARARKVVANYLEDPVSWFESYKKRYSAKKGEAEAIALTTEA